MDNRYVFFEKLTGKIVLEKKQGLFGLKKIILFVSANLKLLKIINVQDINFPFIESTNIDLSMLNAWAKKNNFSIFFSTKNSNLKRNFYFEFESISEKESTPKKKYTNVKTKNHYNENYIFF